MIQDVIGLSQCFGNDGRISHIHVPALMEEYVENLQLKFRLKIVVTFTAILRLSHH